MSSFSNAELALAWDFVEFTGLNVFLTGKAGTGKTTFLKDFKTKTLKRMIVVAPTGVAAINAGGVTIHSFFQLPFAPFIPVKDKKRSLIENENTLDTRNFRKFNREKLQIIKTLDLLVIDEISMVRADLLDSIDAVLRLFRDKDKAFGGVQLLMIGDLQQLAPVIKEEEWDILKNYYDSVFFFSSHALQETNFISIELKHIFRQSDQKFIEILNKIHDNQFDKNTLSQINERFIPDFIPDEEDGYIILTTHNAKAREINEARLRAIPDKAIFYKAEINGDFPAYAFPTDADLTLKPGAQVMFVRNDTSLEKQYFNGKIGIVADIDAETIFVECQGDDYPIEVRPVEWSNVKYSIDENSGEIKEEIIGSFVQYPLKTAWAITIHKSQGLTFEKAIIDAGNVFAHGQIYVALSRCRSLEGLVLSTPLNNPGISSNSVISEFISHVERNPPGKELLNLSKTAYFRVLLLDLFDFSELQRQIEKFSHLVKENKDLFILDPCQDLENFYVLIKKEIYEIAEKFTLQLKQLISSGKDNEEIDMLQERVIKGVNYFIEKFENGMITDIIEIPYETDNKALDKIIREARTRILELNMYKLYSLLACRKGFDVQVYMHARAKALLDASIYAKERVKKIKVRRLMPIKNPFLYNKLKLWRDQKSRDIDLPAYMILHSKVMADLCQFLPSSKKELLKIKGIGKIKAEKYGDELLEIISGFRNK